MITKDNIKDEEFMDQCQCGDWYHAEHGTTDAAGNTTCPSCYQAWLHQLIEAHKETLRVFSAEEKAHGQPSRKEVENYLKARICDKMVVTPEEIGEDGWEELEIPLL